MIILKSGINKEKTPDIIGPINLNGNKIILIKRFSSSSFFLNAPFTYFSMFSKSVYSYRLFPQTASRSLGFLLFV